METSNLLEYSAKHLSLLIECIDDRIETCKGLTAVTNMLMAEDSEICERMEIALRNQISRRNEKLEDLYGLRVAIMNAHQIVSKREKVINS